MMMMMESMSPGSEKKDSRPWQEVSHSANRGLIRRRCRIQQVPPFVIGGRHCVRYFAPRSVKRRSNISC